MPSWATAGGKYSMSPGPSSHSCSGRKREQLARRQETLESRDRLPDQQRPLLPIALQKARRRGVAQERGFHRAIIAAADGVGVARNRRASRLACRGTMSRARRHAFRERSANTDRGCLVQIADDTVVTLTYKLYSAAGELIEETREPITYLHGGHHGIVPRREDALTEKR